MTTAKIGWADRRTLVHEQWPQTEHSRDQVLEAIADYDLLGRVLRDILRVGYEAPRRGQRSPLEWSDGRARLRSLTAERSGSVTTEPFPAAFKLLVAGHTIDAVADTTGVPVDRLVIIADGDATCEEMAAIADAFGKPATYFLEYRVQLIAEAIVTNLLASPERSVDVLVRLGVHPEV